jgi:hypothetical protein
MDYAAMGVAQTELQIPEGVGGDNQSRLQGLDRLQWPFLQICVVSAAPASR